MKKIKLLLFALFICLISISGVSAAKKLTCKYGDYVGGYYNFTITINGDVVYVNSASYVDDFGSETDIYTKYIYDIETSDEISCPKKIYFESDGASSLVVTTREYGEYSIPYSLSSQESEDLGPSQCYNYKSSDSCKISIKTGNVACIWVKNESAPGGGYCNVDNLLYVGCGGAQDIPMQAPQLISLFVNLLKIATPIILIFISIITLFKALAAQKEDEIKKATSSLVKKMISAALVFFVISIVQFVISKVAEDDEYKGFEDCLNCFLNNSCATTTYYKTVVSGKDNCTYLTEGETKTCDCLLKGICE